MISGIAVLCVMQPPDTVLTRMYNQAPDTVNANGRRPRGLLYSSPLDCFIKTVRTEGIGGLYKGSLAHYLRIGPHTVLTLMAYEWVSGQYCTFMKI